MYISSYLFISREEGITSAVDTGVPTSLQEMKVKGFTFQFIKKKFNIHRIWMGVTRKRQLHRCQGRFTIWQVSRLISGHHCPLTTTSDLESSLSPVKYLKNLWIRYYLGVQAVALDFLDFFTGGNFIAAWTMRDW